MLCVNEPGLYALILTSRKAEAVAFKRWIKREVLPSIRKTGSYSMQAVVPTDYLSALEALVEAEKAKRAQALEMEAQRKLLAEAQPNVEFFLAGKRKGHPVTDALCFLKGLSYNQRQWRCWRIASCLTPNSEKENLRCLTILSLPVQIPQVN